MVVYMCPVHVYPCINASVQAHLLIGIPGHGSRIHFTQTNSHPGTYGIQSTLYQGSISQLFFCIDKVGISNPPSIQQNGFLMPHTKHSYERVQT